MGLSGLCDSQTGMDGRILANWYNLADIARERVS